MARKKLRKIIISIVAVLFIVVIVSGIVFFANLNTIAKVGIENVASYVLQVDVSLQKVKVSLLGGSVKLKGLVIGNPEGFKTEKAFSVDEVTVKVDIKSFTTDEPNIKLISIKSPEITLEQGFKGSNLSQLVENASRFESKEAEEPPEGSQKKIKIDKIVINGAQIALSAPVLQGKEISFPLPGIELNDIGGEKERVSIAEAMQLFFTEILSQSIKAGGGIIPPGLDESLQKSLDSALEGIRDASGVLKEGVEELKEKTGILKEGTRSLFGKKEE